MTSRGYSPVAGHGFWGVWASVVVAPWALEPRLSGYGAWASLALRMWDLPGSGMEPTSPALAGGFFTTEPPGKPPCLLEMMIGNGRRAVLLPDG